MKKKDKYLLIIFFVMSLIWTFLVYFNVFSNMDIKIYDFIISFKSEFNTYFFKIITFLCSIKFIALMCILSILLTLFKKDKSYLLIILVTLVSSVVNLIIKNIIRRDRPDKINWLITESNFSFPSGHSMMATVFYGFLTYLLYRSKLNKSLEITSEGMAIIPTEWKTEILCYEFKGKIDDTDFLVYTNVETGREENILVIIDTPNGILTQ